MLIRSALLILYLLVVLSVRECSFPIEFRQRYQNQIGVFPLGLNPDGFPCFKSDFSGLQFSRDRDHGFAFSQLRKDFETRIWDPGDSRYKPANGGIRPWISHIYGHLSPFVAAVGIQGDSLLMTSIILYIDVDLLCRLLRLVFGIREMLKFQIGDIIFSSVSSLPQFDQTVAFVHDHVNCDRFNFEMVLGLHQFAFCWIDRSTLHLRLVKFLRQGLVGIARVWKLKNGLAAFRWAIPIWLFRREGIYKIIGFVGIALIGRLENALASWRWGLIDMRGSGTWPDIVNFFVVILKRITQLQYFTETLVRKCWCHYVYLSELVLDTSALMLRFVKRSHSHKLLYTFRNKEKSNMKLDNNRSFDRLASKATLRKASSNSLLLYFLLVYGTYICVCNNCVSIILYVFVITLLD